MIGIVDYKMGNLASVKNAFSIVGGKTKVVSDPDRFKEYDKLLLPGVGAFGDAMEHLEQRSMVEALREYAGSGKYMLGICLGMQLLFESSQEFGDRRGLGLVKGRVKAFDKSKFETNLKVPHMGWNRVFGVDHPIFDGLDESYYLYFVHSYHVECANERDIIGTTNYGYDFTSAIAHKNILGIQAHPEKSHKNGLKILKNFTKL